MRNSKSQFIVMLFAVVCLIFFIVGSCVLIDRSQKNKNCTESVTATVMDMVRNKSKGKSKIITYSPVYNYYWEDVEYIEKSSTGSKHPSFQIGDKVELKINPDDPKEFYAVGDNIAKVLGIIFTAVGGTLFAVCLTIYVFIKIKYRRNA